jgi:RAB protein geranylgeranyltransferase component A
MNEKGVNEMNNVIPLHSKSRVDKFLVFLGEINEAGQVVEQEQVGMAFLKEKSKTFRLKLWMFAHSIYLVVPDKADHTKYTIYSVEEYLSKEKEVRSFWNKIGDGDIVGNYLRLRIPLFGADLFLSLFPEDLRDASQMRTA